MFHALFFSSQAKSSYFFPIFHFLLLCWLLVNVCNVFWLWPSDLVFIELAVEILKFQSILFLLFSMTSTDLSWYHLFIWLNPSHLYSFQCMTVPVLSCMFLYFFWDNLWHSLQTHLIFFTEVAFTIFYYYYDSVCTVLTFVDINECSEMAPCSQGCENMNGSYKCYCLQGYHLGTGNTCLGKLDFFICHKECNCNARYYPENERIWTVHANQTYLKSLYTCQRGLI